VRVWVDLTNSPHVLVLRPVIAALRARGIEVEVTARDFAQTLALCRRFGIEHTPIGAHAGRGVLGKAAGLARRSAALRRWARGRPRFDLALGHGSNDVTVAAAALRIPSSTMFDYEWATLQHEVNCWLARAVVVPDAIPPQRLRRYGAAGKLQRYPGLKEEYYLADFERDPTVLDELSLDPGAPLAVVLRSAGGFIVPKAAIDAQSLVAYADVVISAGGTMNREAVALGTPVYTVFEGRLGAVDERLLDEGRLRRLGAADEVVLCKRGDADRPARVRRAPGLLADLLLSPVTDGDGA
jgi:uncharacterized protein